MKKIVLASLMMVCLPYWAMSQSVDDDLYFIPKKKAEKKEEVKQEVKVVVPQKQNTTTVYAAPGSTVVVKDVKGKVRDVMSIIVVILHEIITSRWKMIPCILRRNL